MRKFLVTVLCILTLAPLMVSAQRREEESKAKKIATKLEEFLARKGELIIKDLYELGDIMGNDMSTVEFAALIIYKPGQESQRIRGLRVEITDRREYERKNTSFLDLEEIESLLKAIDYMISLQNKWKGINKEYTEVIFSTKGDFKIGFYQKGNEMKPFAESDSIGSAYCFFTRMEDLNLTKEIVNKGLKLLREK